MAITDREIARRLAPPKTDTDRMAMKARVSEAAVELGQLVHQLMPNSTEEGQVLEHLEAAVARAHVGIDRSYSPPGEPHRSITDLSLDNFSRQDLPIPDQQ
ncbi:hypothetical protein AB0K71_06035 [Streptomyces syringium]|uniref:hypothetical protein n=1 Tax=Streptomyces syringium TaxID=76729 RepID=UPI0034388116